ncbi:hypothetical protein BDW62DRAFT_177431 [Aspergillus aurantiobrunneus]
MKAVNIMLGMAVAAIAAPIESGRNIANIQSCQLDTDALGPNPVLGSNPLGGPLESAEQPKIRDIRSSRPAGNGDTK